MRSVRSDLTQFGFGRESGSGGLITRIEALEENVELLEDDVDKAFSQMNYSVQEHVVGEWIDGRTLYEKTIEIDDSWQAGEIPFVDIYTKESDIDFIVAINSAMFQSSTSQGQYLLFPIYVGVNLQPYCVNLVPTANSIRLSKGSETGAIVKIIFTIRYVKTE